MSNTPNKIKYGLKNVYYAVATIADEGTATYGTPARLPGAVSLSLAPQGDSSPFFADNIRYYESMGNTGYEGDLELAVIPDAFLKDILNQVADANDVLYEDLNADSAHFALMFQVEGDKSATKHVFYNCTASRPDSGSQTKNDSVEPQTESVTVTASSIYVAALEKDIVKARTTADTNSTAYDGWFSAVYIPSASSAST